MADKSKAEKKNPLKKLAGFFKGLKAELKKIAWPDRDEIIKNTTAVVLISAVLCGIIRLIDVLAQYLIGTVSNITF